MSKPVTWSHSGLKDFEGCARRYHETKVLKRFPQKDTVHTLYGKEVHKAIELYGRDGTPMDERFALFQPTVDAILAKPGRKLFEYEMGLTRDLHPCDFKDDNRWVRGIADLLIINDDNFTARCVDWKTGSDRYPDRDQLTLMSLMIFAHFPHIKAVSSALVFLVKGSMFKHRMDREEADAAWWAYRERVGKLEAAHDNDVWNPTQSPLCRWCPVRSCPLNPDH
jgi:hypothetical protein